MVIARFQQMCLFKLLLTEKLNGKSMHLAPEPGPPSLEGLLGKVCKYGP